MTKSFHSLVNGSKKIAQVDFCKIANKFIFKSQKRVNLVYYKFPSIRIDTALDSG